jgi:choline-sulfatase
MMPMSTPNLLFLITDQQRADTIESQTACQTPNLDSLAAAGTRFSRCYTPSPICSPARATLMTGLLPHSHGMVDNGHTVPSYRASLQPGLAFWPLALQEAGYRTGYFGKWHVERSNRLQNFGFDTYEVEQYQQRLGLVTDDRPMEPRLLVQQKGYGDFLLYGVCDAAVDTTPEYHLYSDGIRFLHQAAEEPERPWLLMLSTEAPHDPYIALRDYYDRYDPADIQLPTSFDDDLADRPAIYRRIQRVWQELERQHFAQATACYYASCTMIDDQIGRILAALDELGMTDNTLIVFASDHGDYLGAHHLFLKGIPAFEEVYRVPLIIKGPGVPAGGLVNEVVSLLDLAPTLVQLTTGGEFPCQGRSMLPLLAGGEGDWQSEAYAECHGVRFYYTQRILWRDNHKYVFNGFDEDEFYDLGADPHELHNLSTEAQYLPLIESMAARMWEIIRQTDDFNMAEAQYAMFRFAPVGPEARI